MGWSVIALCFGVSARILLAVERPCALLFVFVDRRNGPRPDHALGFHDDVHQSDQYYGQSSLEKHVEKLAVRSHVSELTATKPYSAVTALQHRMIATCFTKRM